MAFFPEKITMNEASTDTISEKTAAAGVTVDGLLIKDNKIPYTGLPDAAAQGDFLARKTASGGTWEDCTTQQASNLLWPLNTYTSHQTLAATNMIILGNHASTAITITLPAVSGNSGLRYKLKNINNALVTVDGNGSELIEDALTVVLARGDSIEIVTNGSAWYKV